MKGHLFARRGDKRPRVNDTDDCILRWGEKGFRFSMLKHPVRTPLFALFFAATAFAQQGDKPNEIQRPLPPEWIIPAAPLLSPEEALASFTVAPGFRVELMAAEPLLGDPVAAVFGPDGRLWVVEMRGYMQDIDGAGEDDRVGSIAVLEDTDRDGRFDRRTVFMDGLVMPRAVSLVGDGVLIAEPPHLWFARDLNGDGVADSKVEIVADYGGTGNPEHMANGLVWMMDNWIYSANHRVRYRYEGGDRFLSEPTVTRGQWGIAQNDAGSIFYNSNSDPLRYDAVPSAYLARHPQLASPRGVNVRVAPADLPTWPGRITPGINRGYQTLRPNGTLASVTAACGPVIYRGALFPAEVQGDAFICEPSGNLVKRIHLKETNGVISGENAYEQSEFLTSTDERFRPVTALNGPDGALWIVDLSRGVIQHRTYVTTYLRAQVKDRRLEEGRGRGRLWRIVPDTAPALLPATRLAQATVTELVQHLTSSSGWVRDTAQRLLVERRDATAVAPLQALAGSCEAPALARLHALWSLDGLAAVDRVSITTALADDDPVLVAAAVRLAETWLKDPADEAMFDAVVAVTNRAGSSDGVIRQIALSLGEAASPRKLATLAELAESNGHRPFMADALVSGIAGQEEAFIGLLSTQATANNARAPVASAVAAVLNAQDAGRMMRILSLISHPETAGWVRSALVDGVEQFLPRRADGQRVAGKLPAEPTPLIALAQHGHSADGERATALLADLRWPGKPGEVVVAPLTPVEQKRFEQGRTQYVALCANCHQPNGQGLAGLAPTLVNSRWLLGDPQLAAGIVLSGKEDGGQVMPALRAVLDDEAIASVLTFLRNSWGHAASGVDATAVAKARADTAGRSGPFNDPELIRLSTAP